VTLYENVKDNNYYKKR